MRTILNAFSSTAVAGDDYVAISKEIVVVEDFPERKSNGHRQIDVFVPIKNDECVEEDEYFFVHIVYVSDCVVVEEYYVLIHILDDDGKQSNDMLRH